MNLVKKSASNRPVIYLIGANGFAQLLPFLVLPVLQHYFFGPEAFGRLMIYITVSEIFISISSFKFDYAIVLEDRLKNRINLLLIAIGSVISVALISLVIIVFIRMFHVSFKPLDSLGAMAYLIPVSVLSYGIFDSLNNWFNRERRYLAIATGKISLTLTAESIKLWTGACGNNSVGLVLGRVGGQFIACLLMGIRFLSKHRASFRLASFRQARIVAARHRSFPMFMTPSILLSVVINFTYVQLFNTYYGVSSVGIMSVSVSYVAAAFGIITASIAQVFYRNVVEEVDPMRIKSMFLKYAVKLLIFSGSICLVIYLIPSEAVVSILGEPWRGMMKVMRIMVLWLSVSFVISSLSFIYVRLGRQKEMLVLDFFHWILVIAAIVISHRIYNDFVTSLKFFAAAQIFYYLIAFAAAWYFIQKADRR